jgi:hypothetical protein
MEAEVAALLREGVKGKVVRWWAQPNNEFRTD